MPVGYGQLLWTQRWTILWITLEFGQLRLGAIWEKAGGFPLFPEERIGRHFYILAK